MTGPTPSDPVGSGNTPDTERPDTDGAHVIARHGDPSVGRTPAPAGHPEPPVEWVRPTDLMARTGSRMAGAGIAFQADMARRSRHAATTSARVLAVRARRLPPVSAFGRGHADRATTRDAVGIP